MDPAVDWVQVPDADAIIDEDYGPPETSYAAFDFGRDIGPDTVAGHEFEVLGYHTEGPIVRIGNQTYKGQHGDLIGSQIVLSTDGAKSPAQRPEKSQLDILATTEHVVRCERVHLQRRSGASGAADPEIRHEAKHAPGPPVILP